MPDHPDNPSVAPSAASGGRSRRFRPLFIAAIALGAIVLGLGIKFGVSAYTASVEEGLEPPKEFKRLRQQPPPEEPAAPEGEAPAATGAPAPTGEPAPTGPAAPTGNPGPTG